MNQNCQRGAKTSMKTIEAYIESKQRDFENHEFFGFLESLISLKTLSCFVPELTFWVMTFQDILRLNEERVQDPFLKKIARHHRSEDSGHDKWFLHDKAYMGFNQEDIAWLYGKDLRPIRDAAYSLVSECYRSQDEILNIVLLLTLESSGHIFFERTVKQVKLSGEDPNLKYFSSSHLEVEMAHAVFENEMKRKIYERELPTYTRREAIELVDRCYQAFSHMFDGLLKAGKARLTPVETYGSLPAS